MTKIPEQGDVLVRGTKVYASTKRADTYVYLLAEQDPATLPDGLTQLLGALRFVLELQLTPTLKLANAQAPKVLRALDEQGYYVQMPPPIEPVRAGR